MKPIKNFQEFINNNIVQTRSPDTKRAAFLITESTKSFNGLQKRVAVMGIDDESANSIIKDCYDILLELIRAKMLLDGFNASGQGAHEAEVSYLKELGFKENDLRFADQLRYFRNGAIYYGKILEKEYAEKVVAFTKHLYPELKKLVD